MNRHNSRINTDSVSAPLYFCNFYRQYRFYDIKDHLFYIWPTLLAQHLSALAMLSEEKQKSAATFFTELSIGYFISTADHQSSNIMDNGIRSR